MLNSIQCNIQKSFVITFQIILLFIFVGVCYAQEKLPAYKNVNLSVEERVKDLVSRMTVEEKVSQMSHLAPAIERLGVIEYGPNIYNPLGEPFEFDKEEAEDLKTNRPWENLEYWEGGCLDGGWWNEALHGVARAGLATAFPHGIRILCKNVWMYRALKQEYITMFIAKNSHTGHRQSIFYAILAGEEMKNHTVKIHTFFRGWQ
jgi:hypothetical protein